ncbi:hypothetical protein N7532_001211 [Penicillium argentinense]|uniref:Uncharacterized protein n=1 Tax=Penicillium argentinense TaxID=1131581 RepID=A0A9W9G2A2_9EURO|nr:uncharacterized protein N7532_001211 [Penicillium argentinense]KAJ5110676.1 hypothetical protein N7532_001211 [Penicillium argentinense]
MSKLSASLKALINSPAARPHTLPAPKNITAIYQDIQQSAKAHNVSQPSWLALSTAATMTMNSPESLAALFTLTSVEANNDLEIAELMREIGLKCISFNGIPRTINNLNAFKASLPENISDSLSTTPTRTPTPTNITNIANRGHSLWTSIYRPFEKKLYSKLASSHPRPPRHNPQRALRRENPRTSAGRLVTSIIAIACLRAQSGVAPQVLSHIFGLRKALEDGSWTADVESEEGARWLASDAGNEWILNSVDRIVEAIGQGSGSSFASPRAKL